MFCFHESFKTKQNIEPKSVYESIKDWCIAWWHSGQDEENFDEFTDWYDVEGDQSYADYGTPCSVETPVQSSVSRYYFRKKPATDCY